jgi:hydrogenase-4 transcriptional activator
MSEPPSVLASYVRALRLLSAAEAVTLFLPGPGEEPSTALLLHTGGDRPVPELADRDAATAFTRRMRSRLPRDGRKRSGALLQVPSVEPYCRLLCLPSVESQLVEAVEDYGGKRRRRSDRSSARQPLAQAWIGFRFSREPVDFPPLSAALELRLDPSNAPQDPSSWGWILAFGGALTWTAHLVTESLRDAVSGLANRVGLQSVLERLMERARADSRPLTLVLFNPDGFAAINDHLGRETGDQVIQAIGERLRSLHRATDFVARYGGAVFAAALQDTSLEDGRQVAEKVRSELAGTAYLDAKVTLTFTAGVAAFSAAQPSSPSSASELLRLADAALGVAKREGGDRTAAWDEGVQEHDAESHDRLRGIFTADVARDYRNMALLLDTLRSVATAEDVPSLLDGALERIVSTFQPNRAGIFQPVEDGRWRLLHGRTLEGGSSEPSALEGWFLSARQKVLASEALSQGKAQNAPGKSSSTSAVSCAAPMLVGSKPMGCLILEYGHGEGCDGHDLHFLGVLAGQLALALDRAELAAAERERQWRKTESIRLELERLRTALQSSQLLYRSPQMEQVLALSRRVAPTDATVLITGESGTGKELLARTLHELSSRRKGPRVVVDCAAIPDTLVESELFGHEKGAFTGADRSKRGRLLEADHGTVLLDEISELPLPVQGRLLRFVQERQFTPVGSERPVAVDVRIVAATNRDLAAEVLAGRFREDLFHRLNVFRLEVPPLRERPGDILFLARHFLDRYAIAYGKSIGAISPSAEQALLDYGWPGNVRELQNCIMRAAILCDEGALERHHLVFLEEEPRKRAPSTGGSPTSRAPEQHLPPSSWEALERALGSLVQAALVQPGRPEAIGRRLRHELLRQAEAQAGGVGRQAARLLGIPETSFRRRLAAARGGDGNAPAGLAPQWADTTAAIRRLLQGAEPGGADLLAGAQRCFLDAMKKAGVEKVAVGAALLGVSHHTYRKRLAGLGTSEAGPPGSR